MFKRVADKAELPEDVRHARWASATEEARAPYEAMERARLILALRDRATPRDRALGCVSYLADVRYRKVQRYLDEGRATAETRRRVDAVLAEHGRADLLKPEARRLLADTA